MILKKQKFKSSSEEYVRIIFKALMHREPDARGLDHFTKLLNKTNSLRVVIDQMMESDESKNENTDSHIRMINYNELLDDNVVLWKNKQAIEFLSSNLSYPNNILVIKIDHIGDFITAFDAILLIKNSFPKANVSIICGSWNAQIARMSGLFHEVYTCDYLQYRADKDGIYNEAELLNLPSQKFDLAIDLRVQTDTRVVLHKIDAIKKCGFETPSLSYKLDICLPKPIYNGQQDYTYSARNHLYQLVSKVIHIYNIFPAIREPVEKIAKSAHDEIILTDLNKLNIAVQPFSGATIKNWPLDCFIDLIERIVSHFDANIYILGSKDDLDIHQLKLLDNIAPTVVNLVGKTSLEKSISIISQCNYYIGNDTGLTHFAAALNIPSTIIFSGSEITTLFAPSNIYTRVIKASVNCRPCFLAKLEDCLNDHKCLRLITVDDVFKVIHNDIETIDHDLTLKDVPYYTPIKNSISRRKINSPSPSKSITVCAVDCLYPELAMRALNKSIDGFCFYDAILFSNVNVSGDARVISIDKIASIEGYNNFLLKSLHEHIKTEYVLILQWDGYIVNPSIWTNDFLNYDYIGAVWPQYEGINSVGNGGFSLRSKKLLDATLDGHFHREVDESEDNALCRTNRQFLESKYSISFAPEIVANLFSYEQVPPKHLTFGFHGIWNIWRHESDEVVLAILKKIPDKYYENYMMMKMLMEYFYINNKNVFMIIFKKSIAHLGADRLNKTLVLALKYDKKDVQRMFSYAYYNKLMSNFLI
jgi:ADP-heptose:LPS heptosyltransferase